MHYNRTMHLLLNVVGIKQQTMVLNKGI